MYTGNKFKELWRMARTATSSRRTVELRGQTAFDGNVRGRVKLILHTSRDLSRQIARFEAGDILVTEMTRPGTIEVCKKASAIVTDEGGILCHAAIISRELKKPCIVGTKVATQVLKDGDEVEVDAERGIVKVIKRAT